MSTSPFAFFRGAAGLMAADLARTPVSGISVQLCGDAHLSNFGGFASPERALLFDLNDFDETIRGPWEWDVKRLVTSTVIAAAEAGIAPGRARDLARHTAREYRRAMRRFASMRALDVWYTRIGEEDLSRVLREQLGARHAARFDKRAAKRRAKDSTRAFAKLAYRMNGGARITADPPLIVPIEELAPPAEADRINDAMAGLIAQYADTLPPERRQLLDRYRYVHAARKVVGVGSVGTRAWVLLLTGRDHDDPLFLQAKEAGPSALQPYCEPCGYETEGERVVRGQHLVQAASDIFLGWLRAEGVDGEVRDFYVRQLWDWKASVDLAQATARTLELYAGLCAWTLARAHARTGEPGAIGAYLGSGEAFDQAAAAFAQAYADQNARDYGEFTEAIRSGRLEAAPAATAAR
jgi:uncharacterized protein (DUF2252 family)